MLRIFFPHRSHTQTPFIEDIFNDVIIVGFVPSHPRLLRHHRRWYYCNCQGWERIPPRTAFTSNCDLPSTFCISSIAEPRWFKFFWPSYPHPAGFILRLIWVFGNLHGELPANPKEPVIYDNEKRSCIAYLRRRTIIILKVSEDARTIRQHQNICSESMFDNRRYSFDHSD